MDFALSKMALIALVGLMVIGPKDLPRAARKAGRMWGRLVAMRARLLDELRESGSPFEDARKAGLEAMGSIRGIAMGSDWPSGGVEQERVGQPLPLGEARMMSKKERGATGSPESRARSKRRVQRLSAARVSKSFNDMAKPGRYHR